MFTVVADGAAVEELVVNFCGRVDTVELMS